MATSKSEIKSIVRGIYDIQTLRIQTGNRISANFRSKLGQKAGQNEDNLEVDARLLIKSLTASYKRITDGITRINAKKFKGDGIIDSFAELALVRQYLILDEEEKAQLNWLKKIVEIHPLWDGFLAGVKGCGPAMAGVIISEFDLLAAKHPASFIKYAGLDVAEDGKGRSKRKEHLVDIEYIDRAGETKTKKGITFNPFLKTKLVGVLGPSFLKAGKDTKYAQIYYNYKRRLENHKIYKDTTALHRHNMSIRYAVKMFLIDLHIAWREIEGLEVSKPYHEDKLGYSHGS